MVVRMGTDALHGCGNFCEGESSGGDEKRAARRGCPFRGPSKEQKRGQPSLSGDKMGLIRAFGIKDRKKKQNT